MFYIIMFYIFDELQLKKIWHINLSVIALMLLAEILIGGFTLHQVLSDMRYEAIYTLLATVVMLYACHKVIKIFLLIALNFFVVAIVNLGALASFLLLEIELELVQGSPIYSLVGLLFGFLLFLLICIRLSMHRKKTKFEQLVSLVISAVGILVFVYLMGAYVFLNIESFYGGRMLFISISMIVLGTTQVMSPFLIMLKDYQLIESKRRESMHAKNYDAQKESYQSMYERESGTIKVRHDMKAQIKSGLALLNEKNFDLAQKHFEDALGEVLKFDEKNIVETGSKMINANINGLLKDEKYVDVEFEFTGLIPTNLTFTTVELTSLFINLIQNALDATIMRSDNRYVNVEINAENDFLLINVENSYNGVFNVVSPGIFKTTKKMGKFHGNGTKIITEIVERNNGYIEWIPGKDTFVVEISFGREIYENNAKCDDVP